MEELNPGDRIRVQGGRNFDKFHGGMEGTIIVNNVESRNITAQFDDTATTGPDPITVAYRHLEHAPSRGGYRAGNVPAPSAPSSQKPKEPQGPLQDEHGDFRTRQLVRLHSLQGAAELNGKLGRLRKYDVNAGRWDVDVREVGIKRLKEDNLAVPEKPQVPQGLSAEELKNRGNEFFKAKEAEQAVAHYGAAIDLLEVESGEPEDPKYLAVLYGNRAQCYINLCREIHGEDHVISKEARSAAMRANMDSARAIELDATNGKAYYRRGCAVLGMAPSASRAKEAIYYLETALSGRASGGKDGVVLPNAMRHEVSGLLDYAKRRLDSCVEAAVPDVEACRENCKQQ